MTLVELRTSVRGKLDDSSYDQATVDECINFAHFQIFNDHRIRFMETNDDIFVSVGDTTADFPDDMQTIINLHLTSPQVYNILDQYIEYGDFMKSYAGYATYTTSQIYSWTDYGNAMRFTSPSKFASTINIDYLRRPQTLVADGDISDIPDQYKEMVVLGALKRTMERNEDYAEASSETANFAGLLTAFVRNEGRGGVKIGPSIMRTNRRSRGGWTSKDF